MSEYLTPTENLTGNLTPVDTMNGIIHTEDVLTGQLGVAGGGAGTSNYNDLTNKPSINNVTLQGNKTTAELNLPDQLGELSDVTLTDLQDSDMLTYVTELGWINRRSANTLSSLEDVNAHNPVGGHALIYNSTQEKWVDAPYSYGNLTGKPTLNNVTISGDKTSADYGLFSGDYDDLTNKPIIPAAQVNSDWNAASGVAQILNKPTLATVATSGSYNDLTDKPSFTTWQYYGSILSETGIAASLTYNDYIKMAIIRISGSTSTPAQSTYTFQLPAFCTPVMELQCYARYMAWLTVSVNRNVVIRGVDTTQAWQSGSILFPYQ